MKYDRKNVPQVDKDIYSGHFFSKNPEDIGPIPLLKIDITHSLTSFGIHGLSVKFKIAFRDFKNLSNADENDRKNPNLDEICISRFFLQETTSNITIQNKISA